LRRLMNGSQVDSDDSAWAISALNQLAIMEHVP